MALEKFRALIGATAHQIHLNNAGLAPMTLPAQRAIQDMTSMLVTEAFHGIEQIIASYEQARTSFGALVGVPADDVAMTQTCAAAISQVAFGLDLRSGDEILRWDQEYPSNAYPWHAAAAEVGASVIVAPSEPDFSLRMDRLLDCINARTRVVTVSWVQYQTGATTDLELLSAACREQDIWLVVDGIQGLGVIPFDMQKMGVDALCGGTHKWLCGPFGHGFLALAPGRTAQLTPVLQGAITYGTPDDPVELERAPRPDARRFEPGSPALLGAVGGAASIDALLDIGIKRIHEEALRLARRLVQGLREAGCEILGDALKERGSPIVTFVPPFAVDGVANRLKQAQIAFGLRAGGIRIAPHGFNTDSEIDKVLDVLQHRS